MRLTLQKRKVYRQTIIEIHVYKNTEDVEFIGNPEEYKFN
jgi:hypothetical protein